MPATTSPGTEHRSTAHVKFLQSPPPPVAPRFSRYDLAFATHDAWLQRPEGGSGIQAKPAIQYAQVVTDRPGQADISLLAQVKPCGKLVGSFNAAGIEADATREIPVSEWFPTVDTHNLRIGYLLDGDVDISSVTSPGTATNTPAWARIVARISTAGGAVSADQLLVDVQVS